MKTDLTLKMEKLLFRQTTAGFGVYGCLEVEIGDRNTLHKDGEREFVDYMTLDSKRTIRCYEIKSSHRDFISNSKVTFAGHYNYYVMPEELYELEKDDIPPYVGVMILPGGEGKQKLKSVVSAKRVPLEEEEVNELIRCFAMSAARYAKRWNLRT